MNWFMKKQRSHKSWSPSFLALCLSPVWGTQAATQFAETDLVSDIPGRAAFTDPNLVNPWGIAYSPTGPFWASDNGTGLSTLYNGAGTQQALVVTVAPPAGSQLPATPTGVVFYGGSGFPVLAGQSARFIFATEDGTISGWNFSANATHSILTVDNSGVGAVYKGLAIGNNGAPNFLYAANFHAGKIDVFQESNFGPASLAGNFTDPGLPAGFAPFNIQNLGGVLYVTYAKQNITGTEDVAGAGNGFVDRFDLNGNFLGRVVTMGQLNSPWGLALAPSAFGTFAGDLLVGNFGDGRINAFNPANGAFVGTLSDLNDVPLEISGLWAITPGNGGDGGATSDLYFTAGIEDEQHGLFGKIAVFVPEASPLTPVALGSAAILTLRFARRRLKGQCH